MNKGICVFCHGRAPKKRDHPITVDRVMCLLGRYPLCDDCNHANFQLVIPNLRKLVRCPVGRLAAKVREKPQMLETIRGRNAVLAVDIRNALELDLDNGDVELEVCRLSKPFYTCVSCQGDESYDPLRR